MAVAGRDVELVSATEADLAYVMATERLPGYDALVGRWDEARHREALADGRYAYLLARAGGEPVGFAIVRGVHSADRVALVQRVAVSRPGEGLGKAMMRAVVGHVFETSATYRLCIGTFPDNLRARRVYEAVGFVAEGVARGAAFFHGVHRDELVLAILRPDWAAARAASPLARTPAPG